MPQKVEIILASGSPRRRELLEREGVSFTVLSADVDESLEPDLLRQPEEAAKKLAERKAGAIVQQVLGDPEYVGAAAIIGADTVVAANGKITASRRRRRRVSHFGRAFRPSPSGYYGRFGVAL